MLDLPTEACSLYAGLTRDIPGEVARTVAELRELERTLERRFQLSLTGLDVLDVAPASGCSSWRTSPGRTTPSGSTWT